MWVQSLGQEDPLEEATEATLVFLPGESHGQRSLVGYSPQDCKESDTTEVTEHVPTHNETAVVRHHAGSTWTGKAYKFLIQLTCRTVGVLIILSPNHM